MSLRVAVTGGTSGLGLAVVRLLSERGDRVAFVARGAARVRQVETRWPRTHGIVGDVSDKEAIHQIAMRITAALGGLDVLINNASSLGPVPLALLADTECEELEEALDTNLLGPFRLTRALLGALAASAREARPALVVNVVSDAAVNAYPTWGAYGASKAGLLHMSRIWDEELRTQGIRIHAVDPGDMDTSLHRLALPDADPAELKRPEESAREIVALIDTAWTDAASHEAAPASS